MDKLTELPVSIGDAGEEFFRDYFRSSADVRLYPLRYERKDGRAPVHLLLIYCMETVDVYQLNRLVLPGLERLGEGLRPEQADDLPRLSSLPMARLKDEPGWLNLLSRSVYSGSLAVYLADPASVFVMDMANKPKRQPEESAMEPSLKGPRDGFTENLGTNMALVRKRICSQSLCIEVSTLGRRGQNQIALFYIRDIINPDILEEVKGCISKLDQDAVIGTSMIERMVTGPRIKSLFPLFDSTGRPDYVASSLLNGRFAIMCDGSPMATIAPASLFNLIKSPEDENMPFHIVAMERILRYIGLVTAMFLPGFYVGLTSFNLEQVPLPLLATIASTRQGLPMPVTLEALIMLIMFDIFAEAGRRLPKTIGQTVTVVGGLIIGDAAIRAGITSPTVIVMIAISIIAGYTLVDPILNGTVTLVRLFGLAVSSFFGLYGFTLGFLLLILHLSSLEHFGVPYLTPVTPFIKRDFQQGVLMKESLHRTRRPIALRPRDKTSGREDEGP